MLGRDCNWNVSTVVWFGEKACNEDVELEEFFVAIECLIYMAH